jgi:hypothetical protein
MHDDQAFPHADSHTVKHWIRVNQWKKSQVPVVKERYKLQKLYFAKDKLQCLRPIYCTDKKEKKIFLIYKEIQSERLQSHI